MKCAKIQKNLSNYLDDAVSRDERKLIEVHLETCVNCQKELDTLIKLKNTLNLVHDTEVPANFSNRVIQETKEMQQRDTISLPFYVKVRNLAVSTAIAAILLLSIIFGNYLGITLYENYKDSASQKETETEDVYGYGLCCVIPDSPFSAIYFNLKLGGK